MDSAASATGVEQNDRAELISLAAEELIIQRASATFSMLELGDRLDTSRTLTYAYFPNRDAIIDAILRRHIAILEGYGLREGGVLDGLATRERMVQVAFLYMRHVEEYGALLHYILREVPKVIGLSRDVSGFFARMLLANARCLRDDLRLSPREALLVIEMVSAIPEELGRMLRRKALTGDDARAVCRRLVENAFDTLVPSTTPSR